LGEGTFTVDDQGNGGEKNVGVGKGMVVIRSRFEVDGGGSGGGGTSPSPRKERGEERSARRGLLSRGRDKSVTPA
jgi:hypothetical protein